MATKKLTHEVVHPKLFLSVGGKLQHVERGTQLFLTDKIAEGLGRKVMKIGGKKSVEISEPDETDKIEDK